MMAPTTPGRLSQREVELARLVADDLSDKEIAQILQISVHTVRHHLDNIGRKLGTQTSVKSRRRAIRAWVLDSMGSFGDTSNHAD